MVVKESWYVAHTRRFGILRSWIVSPGILQSSHRAFEIKKIVVYLYVVPLAVYLWNTVLIASFILHPFIQNLKLTWENPDSYKFLKGNELYKLCDIKARSTVCNFSITVVEWEKIGLFSLTHGLKVFWNFLKTIKKYLREVLREKN